MALTDRQKSVAQFLMGKLDTGHLEADAKKDLESSIEQFVEAHVPKEGFTNEAEAKTLLGAAPKDLRGQWRNLQNELFEAGKQPVAAPAPAAKAAAATGAGDLAIATQGALPVRLVKVGEDENELKAFLQWVKDTTEATSFDAFDTFVKDVLVNETDKTSHPEISARLANLKKDCLHGARAYELLRDAAEAHLLTTCTDTDPTNEAGVQKYLALGGKDYFATILRNAFGNNWKKKHTENPFGEGTVRDHLGCPCPIELIWSYWLEEGMLAQSINAISLRFQNIRSTAGARDPLAALETDPLRPLNNLLWGYIQDERNRLTVRRRAYEYDHHYGLRLFGKAVRDLRPADSRSKFLEAFHFLLLRCSRFFREDSDHTIEADGHPVLNALKELHVVLSFGAHNQFGDLPWQSRVEMLVQMWLLGREEMREFLGGRIMVPYEEPWMGRVDTMKRLQGWTDTSITHFHRLAVYGERILLSVRYVNWNSIDKEIAARAWARELKDAIQAYVHSYRAVTGVDLTNDRMEQDDNDPRFQLPGFHLRRRIAQQDRAQADAWNP